jgi:hypothetical protein
MRILSLNDDDLVINNEILQAADYVVELEAGESIADYQRIQNLTNEEILDEIDYDDEPYWIDDETVGDPGLSDYSDLGSIEGDNIIFVRSIDLIENLTEEQLNTCAFYLDYPGGFAYEIVNRDPD